MLYNTVRKEKMKNIILFCLLTLLVGCSSKKSQSDLTNEEQNIPTNLSVVDTEILKNQDEVIKLLRKSGVKKLNINNLFEINIPASIEVVSLNQYLFVDRDNTQYSVSNYFDIVYQNKYFILRIDCYGDTNMSILNGDKTYNLRKIINPNIYKSENIIKYLKENYDDDSFTNKNNVKMGRLVSNWASGRTSDYYGLYFTLSNNEFSECVIAIYNIWYTFTVNEELDHNDKSYRVKYKNDGGDLEGIFQELEIIENSISFKKSEDSIIILNGSVGENIIDSEYVFPATDNLRMWNKPSLTGEVLGYMENKIYRVIVIGESIEIDGINGNWIMIIPFYGNSVTWVFDGYIREPTQEEKWEEFGW
jgi:hypothetical protein